MPVDAADSRPHCPACSTALPRVSSVAGEPETTVDLKCPTCAFELSFIGPGVHIDPGTADLLH